MNVQEAEARLQAAVDRWVEEGLFSAVFASVAKGGHETVSVGSDPTVSDSSLFDLASLTKLLTATLALRLHSAGLLALDEPLGGLIECHDSLRDLTSEDLLRHRAGLVAWLPFSVWVPEQSQTLEWLLTRDLRRAPAETYSDVGYILWGRLAERLLGDSLETLLDRFVASELDDADLSTSPEPSRVLSCLCDNGQEVALAADLDIALPRSGGPRRGQPQDGNARHLGGLSGHCGLFGSARGLRSVARYWHGALSGTESGLPRELAVNAVQSSNSRSLGWSSPAAWGFEDSLSAPSLGHVGFAGSSFWIDPKAETTFVLLAHRTSPFSDLSPARCEFHRLAGEL